MAPGTRVACSLAYGPDGSRASSFVLAPFTALSSFAGYHPPLAKPLDLLTPLLSRQPPLSLTLPNASRGTLSLPLSLPPFHSSSYPISISFYPPTSSFVLLPRVIRLRFFLFRTKSSRCSVSPIHIVFSDSICQPFLLFSNGFIIDFWSFYTSMELILL